ncbi:MAG: hypothetical protein KGI38_00545 [Thaumarchaeota archaeon]|nr:hypothetical protein [Nitrososphaerota archaeon]
MKAVDVNGDVAFSSGDPQFIYYAVTPPPYTSLDVEITLKDINPTYLNATMTLFGSLINDETFLPVSLEANSYPFFLPMNQQQGEGRWDMRTNTFAVPYSDGIPQMYPFDNYSYRIQFTILSAGNGNINYTRVSVNAQSLEPNVPSPNVVPFYPDTLSGAMHKSEWTLTSSALFTPATSKSLALLTIYLSIDRLPTQNNYLILYPILALYLLLGSSILLRGDDSVTNRLFVYITVFLFSYGFLSAPSSFYTPPFALGLSMAALLVVALLPCTVILAVATILGSRTERRRLKVGTDIAGVIVALGSLYWTVQFSLPTYIPVQPYYRYQLYDIFSLGTYGLLITLALLIGPIVIGITWGWNRARNREPMLT